MVKAVVLAWALAQTSALVRTPHATPRTSRRGVVTASTAAPTAEQIDGSSSYKITVPVQGAVTKAAFSKAAKMIAKERDIPGWRRQDSDKIPEGVVAGAVGAETIKARAIEELSETEVHSAIGSLGIEAVGQAMLMDTPEKLVSAYHPGETFDLVVKIDVWPEAQWDQAYDDGTLEVTVERTARDESVRTKAMQSLRERYVDKNDAAADYAAAMGDSVIVDMTGYARDPKTGANVGPLPVQGAVGGEDLEVVLEVGKFLPGVVEALVGAKAGDKLTVPVDFPGSKEYRDRQPLAGVSAAFEITVKRVQTLQLPELDDAFANKIRPGLTLKELEAQVEDTVGEQETGTDDEKVYVALEKALAQRCSCPLPESVVVESARQQFAIMLADMRAQGTPDSELKNMISPEGFQKYVNVVRPNVETDLRARLAIESIAKTEAIIVDTSKIDEQMEFVRRQYEQQQGEAEGASFDEVKAREKVESELLRIEVLDKVKAVSKVHFVDVEEPAAP